MDYNVKFRLEVENYSDQQLIYSNNEYEGGTTKSPMSSIEPGGREAMTGHKTGWTATGCAGTVSWRIGETGMVLNVMYSVPYSQDLYSNEIGFEISDRPRKYYYIYNYPENGNKKITNKKFYKDSSPLYHLYNIEIYGVQGTMGGSHAPEIKV